MGSFILIGLGMIIIGLVRVVRNLYPLHQYKISREWMITTATILSIKPIGLLSRLRRVITFNYAVDSKNYQVSQLIPNTSWTKSMKEGDSMQVRFPKTKPQAAIVDHSFWRKNVFFAFLHSFWIIFGLLFLLKR